MEIRFTASVAVLLLGTLAPLHAGGFWQKPTVEVITVTDMTPLGREYPTPTKEHPVYYVPLSLGFRTFGGSIAGDKKPANNKTVLIIMDELAKQGYLPATTTSPAPTIAVMFAWGTLYAERLGLSDFAPQINRQQILRFLGGNKIGYSPDDFDEWTSAPMGINTKSYEARQFLEAASDDYYVAVVTAFDLPAIMQKKAKKLWVTRISCPSRGYWMEEVFPTMLAIGSPAFGRESERPDWYRSNDKYKGEVQLGELKVVEYLESGTLLTLQKKSAAPAAVKKP